MSTNSNHPDMPLYAPTSHSLIDLATLAQIARQAFGLYPSAPLHLIQSGLNDHYALPTAQGDFILRVYRHGWRSNADVVWEIELVNHLAQAGAPVAAAVPCSDGRWFTQIQAVEGARQVAVFERAPAPYTHFGASGRHRISPASCAEAFGRSVAQVHAAADTYSPTATRFLLDLGHLLDRPLTAIAQVFTDRQRDVELLNQLANQLREMLEPHLSAADWGACHGDMSGGNSTYWQNRVIHFDFDCAGPGWRAYDLGVFFWSLSINGHGDDVWAPFLQGYRTQRALDTAELALVPAFAAIRVIWLMGLWCANANRFGHHTLHLDYFERELERFRTLHDKAMRTRAGV
ncbi:MAG TPA: phosphotransferase [Roseiflexaceae bacterium]|nr:phosphotransferase [Roseiflexaceae bacterium]